MTQQLIQEGAEAKIFKKIEDNKVTIIKQRINKKYRIEALNKLLIPPRTRREIKVITKLKGLEINVPEIIFTNKKDIIEMEFIKGEKVRDILDNQINLAEEIGTTLALMHDNNIIHGDLTTSNMILKNVYSADNNNSLRKSTLSTTSGLPPLQDNADIGGTGDISKNNKLYFIDFGLSLFSQRLEDKAVDIHLFKQALESKHHKICNQAYELFIKGYKKSKNYKEVVKRLEQVESRGRNIKKNKN